MRFSLQKGVQGIPFGVHLGVRIRLDNFVGEMAGNCSQAHGYSEKTANRGWAEVPQKAIRLMSASARGNRLQHLGRFNPQDQERLVRGRLVENVIEGKDAGSMSAKIFGSEKNLSMWQPEIQAGYIFINAPPCSAEDRERLLTAPEEWRKAETWVSALTHRQEFKLMIPFVI